MGTTLHKQFCLVPMLPGTMVWFELWQPLSWVLPWHPIKQTSYMLLFHCFKFSRDLRKNSWNWLDPEALVSNSDQSARAEEESQSPLPFSTVFPGDRVTEPGAPNAFWLGWHPASSSNPLLPLPMPALELLTHMAMPSFYVWPKDWHSGPHNSQWQS